MNLLVEYIKAIENPDRIGWNGKVWVAPQLKGYDKNQRGYGIDIVRNVAASKLTKGRPGQWLTDEEATQLMNDHISYIQDAARKHIKGFNNLSQERQAALLGMLYRGDSVNDTIRRGYINLGEKDDQKFFDSISNYYRSKGLVERANNSDKFFKSLIRKETPTLKPIKMEPIVEQPDKTRVDRMEYIPKVESKYEYKQIPWGGPEPQTFGGRATYLRRGGQIKKYKLIRRIK